MAAVVPLADVTNQSGVTVILEAMSMGLPVVVTASRGQRECIVGPLVSAAGIDCAVTADRGPQAFGDRVEGGSTGLYVAPGDADGLRAAVELLIRDERLRRDLGEAARRASEVHFGIDRYVDEMAELLAEPANRKLSSVVAVPH
jgi:glycosyltransferase involved in cell wall biosynthesis